MVFFFKQKKENEIRISDWSSDVCTSDLRIDQLLISEIRIVESQFGKGRALLAQQGARGDAGADDEACQQGTRRRSLEVLDDMRFDAGIADHGQRIARGSAFRIVVADDVDRRLRVGHSHAPALTLAPSLWPISLSLRRIAISSRLDRKSTRLHSSH